MIKRRFYHLEHGDGHSASSSSSSSDSEPENERGDQGEEEVEKEIEAEDGGEDEVEEGSGYESEDSSGNEINCDSTGLLVNDYDEDSGKDKEDVEGKQAQYRPEAVKKFISTNVVKTMASEDRIQDEDFGCVLKCKSVFKCRICPRIVCLSEDTLLAHLKSKRHARSKKLLDEGRLKLKLRSDGEIEEEEETHAERHARTVALVQPKRKNKGRQRQSKRRKMKSQVGSDRGETNPLQKMQMTKSGKRED